MTRTTNKVSIDLCFKNEVKFFGYKILGSRDYEQERLWVLPGTSYLQNDARDKPVTA